MWGTAGVILGGSTIPDGPSPTSSTVFLLQSLIPVVECTSPLCQILGRSRNLHPGMCHDLLPALIFNRSFANSPLTNSPAGFGVHLHLH